MMSIALAQIWIPFAQVELNIPVLPAIHIYKATLAMHVQCMQVMPLVHPVSRMINYVQPIWLEEDHVHLLLGMLPGQAFKHTLFAAAMQLSKMLL